MRTIGEKVPADIQVPDERGTMRTLGEHVGNWLVVYFYPKDATPGCTIEAEGFRDMYEEFQKLGVNIVGVSKDTCASHQKFVDKKQLTFTLFADVDHALMEAFGTWGERSFMGHTYMGTSRSTFLIDPTGTIVHVWEKVTPLGHAQEVLDTARACLQEKS